jgi:hypothetical protein
MFFRPTAQIATGQKSIEEDLCDSVVVATELPDREPLIAVLDCLPLENHQLLSGRLIVDDPDNWASKYTSIDRQHGTAMTSLIIHGDLNDNSHSLNRKVYVRPIMKPIPSYSSPRPEHVPDDIIFVDYIHTIINRMMRGDAAVAPSIRIVNLSIGDSVRHFSQTISPFAHLLDWLSGL